MLSGSLVQDVPGYLHLTQILVTINGGVVLTPDDGVAGNSLRRRSKQPVDGEEIGGSVAGRSGAGYGAE
ncbi:unnamed protein product [Heligmosomoides polygyrus]|uniref:Uncharacterized protein n=1 Tax=Heligmosomoides polygyrus TaxID=6339 RepID=A0A183F206_HELPZ|nr:unnamed protein product [Heligmosomoides polygyrus]